MEQPDLKRLEDEEDDGPAVSPIGPDLSSMTPVIVENPFLLSVVKKIKIQISVIIIIAFINMFLLVFIFAVNQGNQTQIYREAKIVQDNNTEVIIEAVKEEAQAAVLMSKGLDQESAKQTEDTLKQLQKLTNAAQQPKVVKK